MYRILCGVVFVLCVLQAQAQASHFRYGYIAHVIVDTTRLKEEEVEFVKSLLHDDMNIDVYLNNDWLVVMKKRRGDRIKEMYHIPSGVIYRYYDADTKHQLKIDSVHTLAATDKVLSNAIDTLTASLGFTPVEGYVQSRWGRPCHMIVQSNSPQQGQDTLWVTDLDVPNLVYPVSGYFSDGLPLEINQHLDDIIVMWGVVAIDDVDNSDPVFIQQVEGYEISIFDSRQLVYELNEFMKDPRWRE